MASRGETNKPLDIFFLGLLLAQGGVLFRFGNGQEIRMQVIPKQCDAGYNRGNVDIFGL